MQFIQVNIPESCSRNLHNLSAPNLHPVTPPPAAFPAIPFCVNDKRWLKRKSSAPFYTYNVQFITVEDSKLSYDHSWFAVNILGMQKSISRDKVNSTTHPRRQEPTIRTKKYSAIHPQNDGNAVTCKPSIKQKYTEQIRNNYAKYHTKNTTPVTFIIALLHEFI